MSVFVLLHHLPFFRLQPNDVMQDFLDFLKMLNIGRSSRSQMFFKVGVFKPYTNFTGKQLCWSLYLIKLQAFRAVILLKRDSNTGVFL